MTDHLKQPGPMVYFGVRHEICIVARDDDGNIVGMYGHRSETTDYAEAWREAYRMARACNHSDNLSGVLATRDATGFFAVQNEWKLR